MLLGDPEKYIFSQGFCTMPVFDDREKRKIRVFLGFCKMLLGDPEKPYFL